MLGDLGGSRSAHVLLASPVEMRYLTLFKQQFLFLCIAASLDRASSFPAARWKTCSLHEPNDYALPHRLLHHITTFAFLLPSDISKGSLAKVQPGNWLAALMSEKPRIQARRCLWGLYVLQRCGTMMYSGTSTHSLNLCCAVKM